MVRKRMDFGRLREALSGPGADPRSWLVLARVDDDDDAIRFDEGVGWIVDVTITSGELAGEGPIACRVAQFFGGDRQGSSSPIPRGCEVALSLPGGDTNGAPIIVGFVSNREDCRVPQTVNGETIDEQFALENHILVSPHSLEYELGSQVRISATEDMKLLAQDVKLAEDEADQAFVRGNDQLDALKDVLDALETFCNSVQSIMTGAPFPKPGLAVPFTLLQQQIAAAKASLESALSTRIKGE